MNWRQLLKPLASLQATVVLFSFSMLLVFFGTLAQKTDGLWSVVDRYFWSYFVMVEGQPFLEFGKIFFWFPKTWQAPSWLTFPLPGGKLLGTLMFINLTAAHLVRFRLDWKRTGIWLAHSGLVLLFFGEVITREFQIEQNMVINQGEAVNYTFDTRNYELAFRDLSDSANEKVTVVPASMLEKSAKLDGQGPIIEHPDLPFKFRVRAYYRNSTMSFTKYKDADTVNLANEGVGLKVYCLSAPQVTGVDQSNKTDKPAVYVEFVPESKTDEPNRVQLFAYALEETPVTIKGKKYYVELRNTHYYKPYSIRLDTFDYEQYVASEKAKQYRSNVTLDDPERGVNRTHSISMNEPLRYRGETFYQHQFNQTPAVTQTVFQVVRNPGWILPYVACGMVTVGLTFHFLLVLTRFLMQTYRKLNSSMTNVVTTSLGVNTIGPKTDVPVWLFKVAIPVACVILLLSFFASKSIPRSSPDKFDYHTAGKIPVVDRGRVKPLDTMARIYLRKISNQEVYEGADGKIYPATKWLLDCLNAPGDRDGAAWNAKVIRIDNDQVRAMMKLKGRSGHRYSLAEIEPSIPMLQKAIDIAAPRKSRGEMPISAEVENHVKGFFEKNDRDVFGAQALEVAERVELLTRLCQQRELKILPATQDLEWRTLSVYRDNAEDRIKQNLDPKLLKKMTAEERKELAQEIDRTVSAMNQEGLRTDPHAPALQRLLSTYSSRDPQAFDEALADYLKLVEETIPEKDWRKNSFEIFLNEFAPFYYVLYGYIFVVLLSVLGWSLILPMPNLAQAFRNAAHWSMLVTIVVHLLGLLARMYISGRWGVFVTNLYSSAVWIGCSAAIVCWIVEWMVPYGISNFVGSLIGFATSIIAHNLAATGDTLEMMEAVLDTNFWLATHVTTVTMGYAATYIAGIAAMAYVFFGVLSPIFYREYKIVNGKAIYQNSQIEDVVGKIIYGIICFATLLSFVGTVLGGIWADQSWGRFWGWDPKENGAVLIVIWNSLILHARWCGLVKARGMAVLAIMGNIVTTWSWFGTNQLGVGLHAYGFNNQLVKVCIYTWFISAGFLVLGMIPRSLWLSTWINKPNIPNA